MCWKRLLCDFLGNYMKTTMETHSKLPVCVVYTRRHAQLPLLGLRADCRSLPAFVEYNPNLKDTHAHTHVTSTALSAQISSLLKPLCPLAHCMNDVSFSRSFPPTPPPSLHSGAGTAHEESETGTHTLNTYTHGQSGLKGLNINLSTLCANAM